MDNLKDLYVAGVAGLAAFLFWLSNYDKHQELSKGARMRKLGYGMGGSAITSWLIFECLIYVDLPFRLALAISAMVAYLGGEVISNILVKLIERKLDKV